MPIIQGPDAGVLTTEFAHWGLATFKTGMRNITRAHYHDCDEFVFMIGGVMVMRSEGGGWPPRPKAEAGMRVGAATASVLAARKWRRVMRRACSDCFMRGMTAQNAEKFEHKMKAWGPASSRQR